MKTTHAVVDLRYYQSEDSKTLTRQLSKFISEYAKAQKDETPKVTSIYIVAPTNIIDRNRLKTYIAATPFELIWHKEILDVKSRGTLLLPYFICTAEESVKNLLFTRQHDTRDAFIYGYLCPDGSYLFKELPSIEFVREYLASSPTFRLSTKKNNTIMCYGYDLLYKNSLRGEPNFNFHYEVWQYVIGGRPLIWLYTNESHSSVEDFLENTLAAISCRRYRFNSQSEQIEQQHGESDSAVIIIHSIEGLTASKCKNYLESFLRHEYYGVVIVISNSFPTQGHVPADGLLIDMDNLRSNLFANGPRSLKLGSSDFSPRLFHALLLYTLVHKNIMIVNDDLPGHLLSALNVRKLFDINPSFSLMEQAISSFKNPHATDEYTYPFIWLAMRQAMLDILDLFPAEMTSKRRAKVPSHFRLSEVVKMVIDYQDISGLKGIDCARRIHDNLDYTLKKSAESLDESVRKSRSEGLNLRKKPFIATALGAELDSDEEKLVDWLNKQISKPAM